MKISKKALLVVASTFLLAGCDKPVGAPICPDCPECAQCAICPDKPTGYIDDTDPKQVELLNVAKDRINEVFAEARDILTYNGAVTLLDEVQTNALNQLDNVNEFLDEEDAILLADSIIDELATEEFRDKVVVVFNLRLLDCMSKVLDRFVQDELNRIYQTDIRVLSEYTGYFMVFVEKVEYIHLKINETIIDSPELEDYGDMKAEVISYGADLFNTYNEFLDEHTINDFVENKLTEYDNVQSEVEARTLTDKIKNEIYSFAFNEYKKGLCGSLDKLYLLVKQYVSEGNHDIVNEVFKCLEDDKRSISGERTFEKAFKNYESAVDIYNSEFDHIIHRWGLDELEKVYDKYNGILSLVPVKYDKFNIEYGKAYSQIENNDSDILDIEHEIKQTIEDFETFCDELLGEGRYQVEGSVFDAARILLDSQTLTHYSYQSNQTKKVTISKMYGKSYYFLKIDSGTQAIYYDSFYEYHENTVTESYTSISNYENPKTIYTDKIIPEILKDGEYVYDEVIHSYKYECVENNTTYIVHFEFGLPTKITSIETSSKEPLYEVTFSDYNSTIVIIPDHDWNYI